MSSLSNIPATYEVIDAKWLTDDDLLRCRCSSQKAKETGIHFYPVIPFGCPYRATEEDGLCGECRDEEHGHVTFSISKRGSQ